MHNPLIAIAASQGSGRNIFLTALPSLLANHERTSKYREFMHEAVSVCITFNSPCDTFHGDYHVADRRMAAATRVLYECVRQQCLST